MRTAEEIVRAEVGHCVSALVSTLAQGGQGIFAGMAAKSVHAWADLPRLCEQAFDLTCPLPDYEEAAREAGWTCDGTESDRCMVFRATTEPDAGLTVRYATWGELCESEDIEPYDREVFEHWIVSPWLGRKLEAKGEKVDFDFTGLTIWARTTTGQAISLDGVIEEIAADLAREYPE